jgi:hypothetical protein
MNILLMPTPQMLAMSEGAGGLFDFNATLPLMALQIILLSFVLTFQKLSLDYRLCTFHAHR